MSMLRAVGITGILVVCWGCCHVRDVSNGEPYKNYVGTTCHLADNGELWNRGGFFTAYELVVDPNQGYPQEWVVAMIGKGVPLKVEAVKRREGKTLIGRFPFQEDYLIVSLKHPNYPSQRIRAEVAFGSLVDLGREEKRAEQYNAPDRPRE